MYPAIYITILHRGALHQPCLFLADHRTATPPVILILTPQTLLALINPISPSPHTVAHTFLPTAPCAHYLIYTPPHPRRCHQTFPALPSNVQYPISSSLPPSVSPESQRVPPVQRQAPTKLPAWTLVLVSLFLKIWCCSCESRRQRQFPGTLI